MAKKRKNNDLQNTTQKTKDRATPTPLKAEGGLGCSERVSSSYSTCDINRITLAMNPVISHERGKDRIVITTNGTYPWSFLIQICHNG
jgi:hypothetical protein